MKLAIIHQNSSMGGWNYLSALVSGIKKISPETDITLFYSRLADSNISLEDFKKKNINLERIPYSYLTRFYFIKIRRRLKSKQLDNLYFFTKKIVNKFNVFALSSSHNFERILENYDVVFYSWPYDMTAPNINKPIFFIQHDFLYAHFFGLHGGNFYNKNLFDILKNSVETFIEQGNLIVSSQFVADDFKKIYPEVNKEVSVIYIPQMNPLNKLEKTEFEAIIKKFGIDFDYILYATNGMHHKNMGQVLGAYYYVKQKYPNIKLIITGSGTQGVRVVCNTPYYCDHVDDDQGYDIISLGSLSSKDFTALMQNAKLVVNASLHEAGCGSGLDAWNLGVPLAMSDIPPYMQQLEYLGTKAEIFDPRNSKDIARAILTILDNPEQAKANAEISKEMLSKYTVEDFARQYLDIFRRKNGK